MDLTWYNSLNKPFFNPPSWIFAPVWTVLYILMAISFILVWKHGIKNKNVKFALMNYGFQLVLNLIWSPIFFGLHNTGSALAVIILMLYFIVQTIRSFMKVDKNAAYLLYPYLVWVSFATILNFSIWFLNR